MKFKKYFFQALTETRDALQLDATTLATLREGYECMQKI